MSSVALVIGENLPDIIHRFRYPGDLLKPFNQCWSCIVGSETEGDIAVKEFQHTPQITGTAINIFVGIKRIMDIQFSGGLRHKLHQALGTHFGQGVTVKIRLSLDHRLNEKRVYIVAAADLVDMPIVG